MRFRYTAAIHVKEGVIEWTSCLRKKRTYLPYISSKILYLENTPILNFSFGKLFDCWGESLLVAKEGEQVAGYILLTTSTNAHQYWIMSLAVDIQHRGKGIARSLLENVIASLTLGSSVKLTVDPKNQPALSLYLSLGFKTLEEEAHYFGDEESRLVMELVK